MNSAIIRTCERVSAVLGVMAVGLCLMFGASVAVTLGVALGAALTWFNLVALKIMVRRALVAATEDGGRGVWAMLVFMKFGLLIGSVYVAVRVVGADPFGVLLGVTSVLGAVIVVSTLMNKVAPATLDAAVSTTSSPNHEVRS